MHRSRILLAALAAVLATLPACDREGEQAPTAEATVAKPNPNDSTWRMFCATPGSTKPCSTIPHDVVVQVLAGYTGINPSDQKVFDAFSWQSFVALNWPGEARQALPAGAITDDPRAPRVWETYDDAADVFGTGPQGACSAGPGGKVLGQIAKNGHVVDPDGDYDEAVGGPLIDRNLNFVVFEKKMSPEEVAYVRDSSLNTVAGQEKADTIVFPAGYYDDQATRAGGRVGSMELKAAWRVLDAAKGDDTTRFYTRRVAVYIPARNSATGSSLCLQDVLVGLVGLHIIHKTQNFEQWVWSTFEHVDNAPDCVGGAGQCGQDGRRYSFFNAQCTACALNDSASRGQDSTFLWEATAPYARRYAVQGQYGAQLARVVRIYPPTDSVNALWRERLKGTVWANYRLIGSQWLSGELSFTPAPDTLGNTTLESFIPTTSSCLGCHQYATTAGTSPKFADFSFLLSSAGESQSTLPIFSRQGTMRRAGQATRHPTRSITIPIAPKTFPERPKQ